MKIKNRLIGKNQPVFIIAEMSGNHNGDITCAYKIIDAAAEAGADAVKLQTYTADTITIDSGKDYFIVKDNPVWKGKTLHELYREAFTPWDWQPKLKAYAEGKGLLCFSSPFDSTSVDFLEKMDVALYKVASFEVVDIPLLERIGKTKKPVIMSRGMATISEIKLAIKTLRQNGTPAVALLHCISAYPAKPEEMNLATIPDLERRFKVAAGLSDHTLSNEVVVAAVALGASIIEKHLTLRRADGGLDAAFSLEPAEFKKMVEAVRLTERVVGKVSYRRNRGEEESILHRKSLFVVQDVKKGEKFTPENVRSIRPGQGLPPKYYHQVIGKRATRDIECGTPLSLALVK